MKNTIMKSMSILLAIFLMVFHIPVSSLADTAEEWKAAEDGIYYISSSEDMVAFANAVNSDTEETPFFSGETVKLSDDINLQGVAWTPMTKFSGTLDGNGHTIKNLTYIAENGSIGGLIHTLENGTIQNLSIVGGQIEGQADVGGIVGLVKGSENLIKNIYINLSVKSTLYSNVGAIAGSLLRSGSALTIENCVSDCTVVSSGNGASAFLGYTELGTTATITDCVYYGTCTGKSWSGGVIGYARGSATLTRCVALGTVTAGGNESGLVTIYSDRAKTHTPAMNALNADPNADISAYVSEINLVDCYSNAPQAIFRHVNRYFRCIQINVLYSDGINSDLSAVANGYCDGTAPTYASSAEASQPFTDAVRTIDVKEENLNNYPLLQNWVKAGEDKLLPQMVFDMITDAGLSIIPIKALEVQEGAAVRMTSKTAIRFTSTFSAEYYDSLKVEYGENNISFGTLIVESRFVANESNISFELFYLMSIPYTNYEATLRTAEDGSYYFYGIAEVEESNLNTVYAALAYVRVKSGDQENYIFTPYNEKTVRSVNQIASKAIVDTSTEKIDPYVNQIETGDGLLYSPYTTSAYELMKNMLEKPKTEQ